jgi:hypothetical protein
MAIVATSSVPPRLSAAAAATAGHDGQLELPHRPEVTLVLSSGATEKLAAGSIIADLELLDESGAAYRRPVSTTDAPDWGALRRSQFHASRSRTLFQGGPIRGWGEDAFVPASGTVRTAARHALTFARLRLRPSAPPGTSVEMRAVLPPSQEAAP